MKLKVKIPMSVAISTLETSMKNLTNEKQTLEKQLSQYQKQLEKYYSEVKKYLLKNDGNNINRINFYNETISIEIKYSNEMKLVKPDAGNYSSVYGLERDIKHIDSKIDDLSKCIRLLKLSSDEQVPVSMIDSIVSYL
jgi:type IV secretory pathway VirB4 component